MLKSDMSGARLNRNCLADNGYTGGNRMFRIRTLSGAVRRGFTLIELLVVIIILAILAAVVIPRVIGRTDDAKIAAATANVSTFDNEMEKYKLDTGNYPTSDQGLQAL